MQKTIIKIIILSLLLVAIPIPRLAKAAILSRPPTNLGLVGFWPMDEGVGNKITDASGQGNTGIITGATWINGKHGKALNFNGSSDFVSLGDSVKFQSPINITFSSWFKTSSNSANMTILRKRLYGYGLQMANGQVTCNVWETSSDNPEIISPLKYNDDKWHQSTCVYNNTGLYLYIDGSFITSTPTSNNSLYYQSDLVAIGRDGGFPSSYFAGSIDEVRVYNRALSQAEISKLYSSGQVSRKQVSNAGLVGYWSMNESRGNKVIDSSGRGNTGSITDTTWVSGKRGNALSFNGSSSGLDVGGDSSLTNLTSDVTLSAWVKPNSLDSYHERNVIISGRRTEIAQPYTLTISPTQIGMTFQTDNVSNGFSGWTSKAVSVNNNIGEWAYFSVVRSGLNVIFYKNGQQVGSPQTFLPSTIYSGNGALIGKGFYGGNMYFNGSIDEVRIYDRALSATEIQNLFKQNQTYANSSQNNKLTNGLVGMWSFNGQDVSGNTAYDRSGQGNNGTITGAVVDQGKVGQALKFDGAGAADDLVNAGSALSLDNIEQQGGGGLTLSAWVYGKGYGEGSLGYIASKANNASFGWIFRYSITGNRLHFNVDYDGASDLSVDTGGLSSTWNQWVHWTVTWDGSTSASHAHIYKNGVEVNYLSQTDGQGNRLTDASQILSIGNNNSGQRTFDGTIDEVRVYNRALSSDEVKQLYRMGQ